MGSALGIYLSKGNQIRYRGCMPTSHNYALFSSHTDSSPLRNDCKLIGCVKEADMADLGQHYRLSVLRTQYILYNNRENGLYRMQVVYLYPG